MSVEIVVPKMGESITEATVSKWLKPVGSAVTQDEPLVELETDKVAVEVPAPASGVIEEIVAAEGATVGIGALLGKIKEGAAATVTAKPATAPAAKPAAPAPVAAKPAAAPAAVGGPT